MDPDEEGRTGISILSFDNGGPGAYSQLLILKEYMIRRANDLGISEEDLYPADFFDLMGGVGFGGLIATMLGHLRMKVEEAIEALLVIASAVFPEGSQAVIDRERNTSNLKGAMENLLEERGLSPDTKMSVQSLPSGRCKVVIYAAASANISHPNAFRTYSSRGSGLNPTIVEAICATMATPSHFSPIKIGPHLRQQSFVGGALGANNPTRLLLNEASNVFGKDRRVAQIISLGSGSGKALSLDTASTESGVTRLLTEMVADCEMVARELSVRLFNVAAYLRLKVDMGMGDIRMDNWLELGDIEAHTRIYFESSVVSHAIDSSLRRLQERIGTITLGQITLSSSIRIAAKKAPAISPHFVLRKRPWEIMIEHLVNSSSSRQKIFPITGMGGCGKTQLVSYFLQEHASLYKHAVYVDAGSLSSIKADLQTWARALGHNHERDVWEDALRTLNTPPQDEQWALILDNADDPTLDLAPFLPKAGKLTILITSRNRSVGNLATVWHLELGEMDSYEAVATLVQAARRQLPLSVEELRSVQELIKELGCLAVALVQAGTYCYEMSSSIQGVSHSYTFTQYLSLFHSHRSELMKMAESSSLDGYKQSVYATLDLSYQALPQRTRDFLHLISFFYHTDFPLQALASTTKYSFMAEKLQFPYPESHEMVINDLKRLLLNDGEWNEMKTQDVIRTLRSFSLVSVTSIADSLFLQLHPLVQAWSRDKDSAASGHYRAMAIQVLTVCGSEDTILLNRYILPHVLDILDQIKLQDLHVNEMMALGKVLKQQGRYRKATRLFETSLEFMKQSTPPEDLNTLEVATYVASIYHDAGRWREAETLLLELLNQCRKLLGAEHPHTLMTIGNLASLYNDQGRWDEAEQLEVEVLEQRRRILGMDHLQTIHATANLASTYHSRGQWDDAEKLWLEVLERHHRVLGMKHPHTIQAAENLSSVYHSQRRWSEAAELKMEVLELCTGVLGMEHPDTIMVASNLAVIYTKLCRWEEAFDLLAPAVQLSLKVLGQEHPHTQTWVKSLVYVCEVLGRSKEAQETKDLLL